MTRGGFSQMEFVKLFNKEKFQVFLLTCPATLPFAFWSHSWFVVNQRGQVSRWEIFLFQQKKHNKRWGHLHKDFYSPTRGLPIFVFAEDIPWQCVGLAGYLEGKKGSLAERVGDFVVDTPHNYPHCNNYYFSGPNSNSYTQWVIDHFPGCGLKLPTDAFGKDYQFAQPV